MFKRKENLIMNKFKLMLALLGAPCMVLASCGDTPAPVDDKKVNSVSVSCNKKTLEVGSTVKASANVKTEGGAETTVTWSSDKESVATVDSTGKITAKGVGTAKIIATSTFDTSKSGSVTITVVNNGPHPELIDEGFEYLDAWPAAKIKSFAGIDTPTFALSGGLYFLQDPGNDDPEEGYAPYIQILVEDTDENYYGFCDALDEAGWHYHYDDYYESEAFIDPTKKVEVDISEVYLDEDYEEAMVGYSVYRTADVWGSAEDTDDTAWAEELAEALSDMGLDLPFVKLGAEYDYDDSEGLFIYDYSPDFNKLDGYGAVLKAAGFAEEGSATEGYYYTKAKDNYSEFIVYFGFTGYGNTIEVYENLLELTAFPTEGINAYIAKNGSIMELPVFSGSDKVRFTFTSFVDEEDEDNPEYAQVGLLYSTEAECNAYVTSLVTNGYKLLPEDPADAQEGYRVAHLQKGKLCVEAVMSYWRSMSDEELEEYFSQDVEQMTDEEYEEFYYNYFMYMFTGSVDVLDDEIQEAWMTLSIDAAGHEVPGLYYNGKGLKVKPEATVQVEVEKFELGESPVLSYVSDHPEIASVSDAGVVTGVAEGSAVITVSTHVDDKDYSVDVPVVVKNVEEKSLAIAASDIGSTSQYSVCDGDHTIGGFVINSKNVSNNKGIQFKKNCSTDGLANKTAFENGLISIVIAGTGALTVAFGADGSSLTPVQPVQQDGAYVYTAPEGSQYFMICNASGSVAVASSITINYLG